MKTMGLKRGLLGLFVFCGSVFVYLFWQQKPYAIPQLVVHTLTNAYSSYTRLDPRWTWVCVNQRCEKRERTKEPSTSLSTCNMLCGSTQLWPQPTGPVTLGSHTAKFLHEQFRFETTAQEPVNSLLKTAFATFNDNIAALVPKSETWAQKSDIQYFRIKFIISDNNTTRLRFKTDESYNMTLKAEEQDLVATIRAKTFFGARHGLETLSQLIWWDEFESEGALKVLRAASVQDRPIFAYRGLMVDTARNFMPVDALERVLVGMAASKLNVFHWHISDSQSFPLMSKRVPQLAQYGAYGPEMVYTGEDVKSLVEFARVRGIRVVIEIDTPAHAGNGWTWGVEEGLGELAVCVNEQPWSMYCGEPPCGQLNPNNPNVYDVLEKLYKDLLELTEESEIFHLGGDEVNLECWSHHMSRENYTDFHEIWGEFTIKALTRLQAANGGKKMPHVVIWSSNLSKRPYTFKYLDKNQIVVQTWGPNQWGEAMELTADGYKVIISHVDAWYLDCGFGKWRETGEAACDPYRPWQTVYNHRPWQQQRITRKQILGAEVCLWSEQVDAGSLDTRLWPRAAAFAERVWSDPQVDPSAYSLQEDVYTRLGTHRNRLVSRGLGAEAMWPQWCAQNPGLCL